MEIGTISNLAKGGMVESDYNNFMARINNRQLNLARLFVEDKMDEIVFSREPRPNYERLKHLKRLDAIITQEYINQIDVKDVTRVSK